MTSAAVSEGRGAVIEVNGLKKTFFVGLRRKRSDAVRDISFEVQPGEVFGFLGPNGAGKTTTIKLLLGLIRADGGTLRLLGEPIESMNWRTQVGYMPEHPTFYDFLTGFELVVWFGRLAGMSRHEAEGEAKRHLERVGLAHALHRRIRGYSKGMMQRAGLAQALMGSPKLLILDEPMTGLDPIGRRDIRDLILELRAEGKTVFYSTHILPDVEMTCDRVAIVHQGMTKRTGRLEDILTETTRGVSVAIADLPPDEVARIRSEHPGATIEERTLQVEVPDLDGARAFTSRALAAGGHLVRFEPHRETLEAIFMRLLGPGGYTEPMQPGQTPTSPPPSSKQNGGTSRAVPSANDPRTDRPAR